MSTHLFVPIAVLLIGTLIAVLVRQTLRVRRSANTTWEELLARLEPVDRDGLAAVALDTMGDDGGAFELEPAAIWKMLGGLEGLEALERNCGVLIELATYVQRWHPEAVVVAEQLRLNAREIEWHVGRLKGSALTGNLQTSFASYGQRAAATYYQMTQHVLALYEQAHFPELAQLQGAI